jgi:hypothetical protein
MNSLVPLPIAESLLHEKYSMVSRSGHEYVIVRCPYCWEDAKTSWSTLAWYGKVCPGCGAYHTFLGFSKRPTEKRAERAERRTASGISTTTRRVRVKRAPGSRAGQPAKQAAR